MSLHLLETRVYTYGALDQHEWKQAAIPFKNIKFILSNHRNIVDKNNGIISTCDIVLHDSTEPLVARLSYNDATHALEHYLFIQAKKE